MKACNMAVMGFVYGKYESLSSKSREKVWWNEIK